MEPFASVPEQPEAKRLLTAALTEGGAHAYLLHGPAGVGKRTAAFAFAGALLGDARRVELRTHPDLYLLEPLGEMIRIDDVRALRHDLHMRPFEGDRRVYLVLDADRMNDEAADALLKDLEEPPSYAVIVLVAGELGPLPPTISRAASSSRFVGSRSARCGSGSPRRRPSRRGGGARAVARVRRAARPGAPPPRPGRVARRDALIAAARSVYLDPAFDPGVAAGVLLAAAAERGEEAREREQALVDTLDLPARDADQRVRRAYRGAEREELLAGLEGLEALVPRSRRRRRGCGRSGRSRRSARRHSRGHRGGCRRGRGRRRGSRPRDLARARGVQPEPVARARGAVRPRAQGMRPRGRVTAG